MPHPFDQPPDKPAGIVHWVLDVPESARPSAIDSLRWNRCISTPVLHDALILLRARTHPDFHAMIERTELLRADIAELLRLAGDEKEDAVPEEVVERWMELLTFEVGVPVERDCPRGPRQPLSPSHLDRLRSLLVRRLSSRGLSQILELISRGADAPRRLQVYVFHSLNGAMELDWVEGAGCTEKTATMMGISQSTIGRHQGQAAACLGVPAHERIDRATLVLHAIARGWLNNHD